MSGMEFLSDSRYRLLETIGSGGMGMVYRAWDERLGRDVAIKCLHPSTCVSGDVRARFLREARALARLDHPRIARIFEVVEQDRQIYLVQEYLHGEDLAAFLVREERLPPAMAEPLALELAEALEVVHGEGLVHRDLKPSNVFLVEGRGVCLLDLGLVLDPEETRLTMDDMVVGTLHFLSPEMIRGDEPGPPSDVYQFGLVLHLAMTGRLLDRSEDSNWKELIQLASVGVPNPEVDPSLPVAWRALIGHCCRKDACERPADGASLRAIVEKGPGRGSLDSQRETPRSSILPTRPSPRPEQRLLRRLRKGIVLFTLVGLLLFGLLHRSEPRPIPSASLLRLEDLCFASFPDGALWSARGPECRPVPIWEAVDAKGAREEGRCRRLRGRWVAEWIGAPSAWVGSFRIRQGERPLFERKLELPSSIWKTTPRALCTARALTLRWELHGQGDCDVFWDVAHGPSGRRMVRELFRSEAIPKNAFVNWRLTMGRRSLASGRIRAGIRPRWICPDRFGGAKRATIERRAREGGGVDLTLSPGQFFSLRPREGLEGPVLEIDWAWNAAAAVESEGKGEGLRYLRLLEGGGEHVQFFAMGLPRLFRLSSSRRRELWRDLGDPSRAEDAAVHGVTRAAFDASYGEGAVPIAGHFNRPRFASWGDGVSLVADTLVRAPEKRLLLGVLDHGSGAFRQKRLAGPELGRVETLVTVGKRAWILVGDRARAWLGHVVAGSTGPVLVWALPLEGGLGGERRRQGSLLTVAPDGLCALWVRGTTVRSLWTESKRRAPLVCRLPLPEESWVAEASWLSPRRCLLPVVSRRVEKGSFILSVQVFDLALGETGARPRILGTGPSIEVPELFDRPILTNLVHRGDRLFLGSIACLFEGRMGSPMSWENRWVETAEVQQLILGKETLWMVQANGWIRGIDL